MKGFTAIEGLLILVAVSIISATGLYIYQSNNDDKNALSSKSDVATKSGNKKVPTPAPAAKDPTASWLLYTAPGGEYSMRLADGWQLERYQKTSGLFQADNSKLVSKPGTKAVITEVSGGKDYIAGLFINYATENLEQIYNPGDKQSSLKTADGLEVEKYYMVQAEDVQGIGLPKGGIQYTYVIRKNADTAMVINYSFVPGATDYHETVEAAIATLRVN